MDLTLKKAAMAVGAALSTLVTHAAPDTACVQPLHALSLRGAIELALCSNPGVRSTRLDATAAAAERDRTRASYLPTVSASVSAAQPSGAARANLQQTVAVSWLLLDFGERKAKLSAATATLQASESLAEAQGQELAFSVAQSYLQLGAAQAAIDSAKAQEQVATQALSLAQARLDAGDAIKLDVLQARSALAQVEVALAKARASLATQRAFLAHLLAVPAEESRHIQLAAEPANEFVSGDAPAALADLVAQAKAARPDIAAARARALALHEQAKAARAAYFPSVSLNASASRSDPTQGPASSSRAVNLLLNVPLYSAASPALVRSLSAQALAQAERADGIENRAGYDVVAAYEGLLSVAAQFKATLSLEASSREAQDQAQARYRAGVGTSLEMMDAIARKSAADETLIGARLGLQLARAQLARALGQLPLDGR